MEKIRAFFDSLLDIAFPDALLARLGKVLARSELREAETPGIFFLLNYRDPVVRRALWQLKYRGSRKIAALFAEALLPFLLESASEEMLFGGADKIVLAPIPSGAASRRKKGFSQTEILVRAIARGDRADAFHPAYEVLMKIKETSPQAKIKARNIRLTNVKGSMAADRALVGGKIIFLIDDVTTTGATLAEGARALRAAGARKVLCFAVCH